MRSSKKELSRPKCEGCGKRIYRPYSLVKSYMWRKIPSHCPYCGKQFSFEKKKHLLEHEELRWMLLCCVFIIIFIVLSVIFI